MDATTSRKQAPAKVLERQSTPLQLGEAREGADIGELAEFAAHAAMVGEADDCVARKVETLPSEAVRRRNSHSLSAGGQGSG